MRNARAIAFENKIINQTPLEGVTDTHRWKCILKFWFHHEPQIFLTQSLLVIICVFCYICDKTQVGGWHMMTLSTVWVITEWTYKLSYILVWNILQKQINSTPGPACFYLLNIIIMQVLYLLVTFVIWIPVLTLVYRIGLVLSHKNGKENDSRMTYSIC